MKKNRDLKTKGLLGEKTYKLLGKIPIESIEIDSENRVVLRLLKHINKADAQTLLKAITKTVYEDGLTDTWLSQKELELKQDFGEMARVIANDVVDTSLSTLFARHRKLEIIKQEALKLGFDVEGWEEQLGKEGIL